MFHLLGNFFFGSNRLQEEQDHKHDQNLMRAITQVEGCEKNGCIEQTLTEASTQTSIMIVNTCDKKTQEQQINDIDSQKKQSKDNETDKLDWVIIDKAEGEEKYNPRLTSVGTNTSMMISNDKRIDNSLKYANTEKGVYGNSILNNSTAKAEQKSAIEERIQKFEMDDETLLGSFFERNQTIDKEDEKDDTMLTDDKTENTLILSSYVEKQDWLITPLPCLTSITTSQRSIIENHPLENLLIEHPSMSVFVTATSSSNDLHLIDMKAEENQKNNLKDNENENSLSKSSDKTPKFGKRSSEKRKECESMSPVLAEASKSVSPLPALKKKVARNKKNKKTLSPSVFISASQSVLTSSNSLSSNKENVQVKSGNLLNYSKLAFNQSSQSVKQEILSKKTQLNRCNKILTFSSIKNVSNKQQRKHHKLQQPAFSYSNQNY